MENMSEKIKILYLSSSPADQSELEVDKEFREIYQSFSQNSATLDNHLRKDREFRAVYENAHNRYFTAISVSNLRASDIQAVVLKTVPEIIHFSGHASADEIFFENAGGESKGVSKNALVNFFGILRKKPDIVFFNACRTSGILKRLSRIIDFVVVTRQAVDDAAAVTFAAKFYEFLSLGQTVKTAFECAKSHFDFEGRKEDAEMYQLFMRSEDRALPFPEINNEEEIPDAVGKEIFVTKSEIRADEVYGSIVAGRIGNVHQHIRQEAERKQKNN
jgi:hypothetical protein